MTTPRFSTEQVEYFEKEVRPLLAEHCHKCHGDRAQKGSLRLDSRAAVLAGGDTGPAVVPGKPDESLLIDAVSYGDLYQMPPSGKLPDKQIAALRRWVELGAVWPASPPASAASKSPANVGFDLAERAKHWAFQPLGKSAPPLVKNTYWPRSSEDAFLLAPMEAAGLPPAEPADKRVLLRRITFDLIGLPPSLDEITAFLSDGRPDAFERVVDRLLASPHFGERWGRHWLDLVRYAESKGHEFDYTIPNAWQYRDYVTRAFNADVPYNQFVCEHLAGDLLDRPRRHPERGFNESVLGTGFWFLGEEVHSPIEVRADELDRTDNKIDVFSKTFLALTVACARCHDHKFDAITAKDYYALAGYVLSASYRQTPFDALDEERKIARRLDDLHRQHRTKLLRVIAAGVRPALDGVGELLLAARDVLQAAGPGDNAAAAAARARAIEAAASQRGFAPSAVAAWVEAVRQAAADAASPLHGWALRTATNAGAAPRRPPATAGPPKQASTPDATLVIDYANPAPADWRQDGFAFGLAPAKAGDLSLSGLSFSGNAEWPIARIWQRGAAVSDPFWDSATLAPGVERESGRLAWLQSGRMLRSPTFTLTKGKLYYLVSGSGYAYAAVHGHRMNSGPLHAGLVRQWHAVPKWQWIEHDLSAYRGERVHVELSPRQPGEAKPAASPILAIAQVVQGEQPPPDPAAAAGLALAGAFSDDDLSSVEALAAAYQRRLLRTAEQMSVDALAKADENDLAWADWLVRNLQLFVPAGGDAGRRLAAELQTFASAQAQLAESVPRHIHTAPAMFDGNGVDERLLLRGNHKTPGDVVPRRYLEALGGVGQPAAVSGSGRLELARQVIDGERPLAARVIVNRVWQRLFGRGIVASVDNFGAMGAQPSHPELLEWLSGEFIQDGWSIKRLIRRLALTSAYQQSSRPSDAARSGDSQNALLSHASIKRLEAEAIRDSILAVSGRLDRQMFGASVPVHLSEFMEGRGRPASGPVDGGGRRSVYLSVRRNFLSTLFLAFDYPAPFSAVGRRGASNVPAQALTLMNSPFVAAEALRWAKQERPHPRQARIGQLYREAFGRLPNEEEMRRASDFLDAQSQRYRQPQVDDRAWADLCHVLLNAKEFIFIP